MKRKKCSNSGSGSRQRTKKTTKPEVAEASERFTTAAPWQFDCLGEARLVFSDWRHHLDPRLGLIEHGPFGLNEPGRHRPTIEVGVVGTDPSIESLLGWLKRCEQEIPGGDDTLSFPGLKEALRATWATRPAWQHRIAQTEIEDLVKREPRERFRRAVELFGSAVRLVAQKDPSPHVVFCALPSEILDYCRVVGGKSGEEVKLGPFERSIVRGARKDEKSGQISLLPSFFKEVFESAKEPDFRDFRRALKAAAMALRVPIQLAHSRTWDDNAGGQPPALRAWNFCVATYYKAGGIPWSVDRLEPGTCYLGVDFFHRRNQTRTDFHTSLAQVFDEQGEGHILRGAEFVWTKTDEQRSPHLPLKNAKDLLKEGLERYRAHVDMPPTRVVVHRRGQFSEEEMQGFNQALADLGIRFHDYVEFSETAVRLLREGQYPPVRGTTMRVSDSQRLLYTVGFVNTLGTYDAGHIPRPLLLTRRHGDSSIDRIANETMALTRLDWNSVSYATSLPITLNFADRVSEILTELSAEQVPEAAYRFYM